MHYVRPGGVDHPRLAQEVVGHLGRLSKVFVHREAVDVAAVARPTQTERTMQDFTQPLNRRQLLVGGAAVATAAFLSNGIATAQVVPTQPAPVFTQQTISVTDN